MEMVGTDTKAVEDKIQDKPIVTDVFERTKKNPAPFGTGLIRIQQEVRLLVRIRIYN